MTKARLMSTEVTPDSDENPLQERKIVNNLGHNRYVIYLPRKTVEDDIISALNSGYSIILVQGSGGIGKSAILFNLLEKIVARTIALNKEIDKVFWFSDGDQPQEVNARLVVERIRNSCKDSVSSKSSLDIQEELTEIQDVFDSNKISLLVIDNFETVKDKDLIDFILYKLPLGCTVLLTSKYGKGHYMDEGLITDRLDDSIAEINIPKLQFVEWEEIFNIRCERNRSLNRWKQHFSESNLSIFLNEVYQKLDGNIFGMISVVSQLAKRQINDPKVINTLLKDEGLYKESFDRILSDSWDLLSRPSRSVLLAALLQGFSYIDFNLVSQFTNIGKVMSNIPKLNSALDRAVNECIDLNLMEQEYTEDNKGEYYLSPIVMSYLSFQMLKNEKEKDPASDIMLDEFSEVIDRWIKYYVELSKEIGFCYDDTRKMKVFDEPTKRDSLIFVLEYCFTKEKFREYVEISNNLRYFFYTRAIWENSDNCIHLKRSFAARAIEDYLSEFEAIVYFVNIAAKNQQLDKIPNLIDRANTLCEQCDITKDSNGESYFRYQHALGLYYYAQKDYLNAYMIWQSILSGTICTNNTHDIDAAKRWELKCIKKNVGGTSDQIIEKCLTLLEESKAHSFERGIVDYSLIIADEYINLNRTGDARRYLDSVRELVETTNDSLYFARFYLYSALCCGETEEGSEYLIKAFETYEKHSFDVELANQIIRLSSMNMFQQTIAQYVKRRKS